MMIRLSRSLRRYLFIAFMIYLMTIVVSFLIYFLLILVEKRFPWVNLCVYVIGETILNGLNLFSKPLRYFLPNLSDDEYYLLLINAIVTTFALVYAYLFCKWSSLEMIELYIAAILDIIRPDVFTGIPSIPSTVYLQWLEIQRRFQEIRRAA